ncbi:hypothetical protein Hanom_Chr11g01027361 [Helianthus anomalus]
MIWLDFTLHFDHLLISYGWCCKDLVVALGWRTRWMLVGSCGSNTMRLVMREAVYMRVSCECVSILFDIGDLSAGSLICFVINASIVTLRRAR